MQIIYPQLDGVKINENRTLPTAVIQAIRKAYDYIAQITTASTLSAVVIENTHANRSNYPPANQALGSFYIETDRTEALYVIQEVSAAHQWVLVHAAMRGLLAARPADLTTNDVGFFYTATNALDYRWSGTAWTTLDTVRGGAALVTTGAIPRVSATGTLGQSALSDSGSIVSSTEPIHADTGASPTDSQLSLTANALGAMELLAFAADNIQQYFDAKRSGGSLIAASTTAAGIQKSATHLVFRGKGGLTVGNAFSFTGWIFMDLAAGYCGFGGNASPAYPVDATGDINTSTLYRVAATPGITQVVALAKLTLAGANGSLTVTGGIITAYIAPT